MWVFNFRDMKRAAIRTFHLSWWKAILSQESLTFVLLISRADGINLINPLSCHSQRLTVYAILPALASLEPITVELFPRHHSDSFLAMTRMKRSGLFPIQTIRYNGFY
jgi:hypothetical protein